MSTPVADRRKPNPSPHPSVPGAVGGREVMDVDLDLDDDPSSWPFDPLAFISNPPSPLFLSSFSSSSSPSPFPLIPFASPPSPLWIFDDRTASADATIGNGASDLSRFVACSGVDGSTKHLQLAVEEGGAEDSCMIKERMTLALRNLKESTDKHLLVQVWAPVRNGDRYVLTTSGQPFVLDPHSSGLLQYRTVSVTFVFSVDGENDSELGLPGRVFRQKVPEWTPNVQYYSSKEYPRLSYALNYNVQGTLALPVFELSGQSCVGVVELIMTSPKINYAGEVDKVCKALEAVNLKSSKILDHPTFQICNEGRQAVFAEILQTLTMVCEEHHLPLAQTWVPCRYRSVLAQGGGSRKSCSSFDGSCMGQVCMSTTDVAFHVIDGHMWGFREACVEHHLQKGQGVAGRSFAFRRPFFCKDITQFCKTEYPLVHYARMFKLLGSFAICLQSDLTGSDDYILEFFLPPDCKDFGEQQAVLKSMLSSMQKCFCCLKIAKSVELQEENCLEDVDMFALENEEMELKNICVWTYESRLTPSDGKNHEALNDTETLVRTTSLLADQIALMDANGEKNGKDLSIRGSSNSPLIDKNSKPPERRRGKAEKKISLEVLQQYFTGSLKDAAKSLGVCPTTMKRICRQHGITRWPSRKINKVNRSLSKLKRVLESVQGSDGSFNLTSFTGPLPSVPPIHWPVNLDDLDSNRNAKPSNLLGQNYQELLAPTLPNTDNVPNVLNDLNEGHHDIEVEPGKASHSSKSRSSSGQGSTNAHTSEEDSCQGNPTNEMQNQLEDDDQTGSSKPSQSPNSFINSTLPNSLFMEPQIQQGGRLVADSGSSKNLNDLCKDLPGPLGFHDEHNAGLMTNPSDTSRMQDLGMVTMKAIYKEDIIRFRIPFGAGIVTLKNEVAKRLKLDTGTFDIKYLDDDQEWVILACNSDLEECMEISKRLGKHLIRLLVSDTSCCLGSSCESSGGQ